MMRGNVCEGVKIRYWGREDTVQIKVGGSKAVEVEQWATNGRTKHKNQNIYKVEEGWASQAEFYLK